MCNGEADAMDNGEAPQSLYPYDGEVLWVTGEVDLLTAPILRRRLHQAAAGGAGEAGAAELVADLSAVTFMDCAGLEPLLEARAYLGGRLRLRGVPWAVVHMLRLTGLLTTFTILDPVQAGTGDEQARRHDEAFARRLASGRGHGAGPTAAADQDPPSDRSPGEPEGQQARVLDLPEARHHTPTIEQARGLLMGTHGCDADLAWC
jgi:anti-anti-sigma factor